MGAQSPLCTMHGSGNHCNDQKFALWSYQLKGAYYKVFGFVVSFNSSPFIFGWVTTPELGMCLQHSIAHSDIVNKKSKLTSYLL